MSRHEGTLAPSRARTDLGTKARAAKCRRASGWSDGGQRGCLPRMSVGLADRPSAPVGRRPDATARADPGQLSRNRGAYPFTGYWKPRPTEHPRVGGEDLVGCLAVQVHGVLPAAAGVLRSRTSSDCVG